ncbi:sensor domain-containing diguanylate cyclase [Noviherbaspirillum sp.]|uniref:GGDEF domain-containing protein n=1 Tax=Noviherbaspirillum sp. TaxID=1926288 RepID=UPI002B46F1A6|nr:sensor domain-containing diguanylate cyclase [Noviherbaspirillum sp.]HJV81601.1 sensor domain-containing diguanylate cyclase [Noviherbaspirillum sp.]
MSQELLAENLRLRKQLSQLLAQAKQNQQILQRHQTFDLQFIGAGSFLELIDTIFHSFASSASLDTLTLSLLDPEYAIRRILVELDVHLSEMPQLLFLQDESEFGELSTQLSGPVLGGYSEQFHGHVFPEPLSPPASVAIVPLIRRGALIGCIGLGSNDVTRFAPHMSTDFLEHMASILAICLENVINTERLKHIGLTDTLTGVNNRRYVERRLVEEIGRSQRHGYPLSCMYIDIDHFKQINDSIGHQAGDEVLRDVAARIKAELRLSDALGRFGGEEFVALLIDAQRDDAVSVAERIRRSVAEQPMILGSGEQIDVTVSIGVASLATSKDHESVEKTAQKFLARADQALYQAKKNGRNRVISES